MAGSQPPSVGDTPPSKPDDAANGAATGTLAKVVGGLDSVTKVLLALGSLVAAAAALWLGLSHFGGSGSDADNHHTSPPTTQSTTTAPPTTAPPTTAPSRTTGPATPSTAAPTTTSDVAQRVAACEATHLMTSQVQRIAPTVAEYDFVACAWPPRPYADADGFSKVVLKSVAGPGDSEASGTNNADRITGPCTDFALTYDFGSQGDPRHLAPFVARRGTITTVDAPGTAWPGGVKGLDFYPDSTEVDVLHNDDYVLSAATCHS